MKIFKSVIECQLTTKLLLKHCSGKISCAESKKCTKLMVIFIKDCARAVFGYHQRYKSISTWLLQKLIKDAQIFCMLSSHNISNYNKTSMESIKYHQVHHFEERDFVCGLTFAKGFNAILKIIESYEKYILEWGIWVY